MALDWRISSSACSINSCVSTFVAPYTSQMSLCVGMPHLIVVLTFFVFVWELDGLLTDQSVDLSNPEDANLYEPNVPELFDDVSQTTPSTFRRLQPMILMSKSRFRSPFGKFGGKKGGGKGGSKPRPRPPNPRPGPPKPRPRPSTPLRPPKKCTGFWCKKPADPNKPRPNPPKKCTGFWCKKPADPNKPGPKPPKKCTGFWCKKPADPNKPGPDRKPRPEHVIEKPDRKRDKWDIPIPHIDLQVIINGSGTEQTQEDQQNQQCSTCTSDTCASKSDCVQYGCCNNIF